MPDEQATETTMAKTPSGAGAYEGVDGCSTGDCPHGNVNECLAAQGAMIADLAAAIERLEADLDCECGISGCRNMRQMCKRCQIELLQGRLAEAAETRKTQMAVIAELRAKLLDTIRE